MPRRIEFESILAIDAMYFHAARSALEIAESIRPALDIREHDVAEKQVEFEKLRSVEEETGRSQYESMEPLAIELENDESTLGREYAPLLQAVASVHVLGAACLEAHINSRGHDRLTGAIWEQFERSSLEAKWLFLPPLCGIEPFDPGGEPYQGFARLIRFRNALLHFKPKHEPWQLLAIPSTVKTLGLTVKDASRSLEAVHSMVAEFARRIPEEPPHWLASTSLNVFDFKIL